MFTVLLTCVLLAGSEWIPPTSWEITKVHIHHTWAPTFTLEQKVEPDWPPRAKEMATISLKRTWKPGEELTLPAGCKATAQEGTR